MSDLQRLEKSLAELLGWTHIQGSTGCHPVYTTFREKLPRWTADDAAAFQLLVEYDIFLDENHMFGKCTRGDHVGEWSYANCYKPEDGTSYYPDKATAVRVAIVKAVIAKLTAASGLVPTPCFGLKETK
jgi:hypothetical protein